jgi:hypothetical protein
MCEHAPIHCCGAPEELAAKLAAASNAPAEEAVRFQGIFGLFEFR